MRRALFQSTSACQGPPGFRERSGQQVGIVGCLNQHQIDEGEVGRMYRIRFDDGVETDAFADELTRNQEE